MKRNHLILLSISFLIFVGWLVLHNKKAKIPEIPPPAGYVKYENSKFNFFYYHPADLTAKEFDEGGGAITIVDENKEKTQGLQIFIVPYSEKVITEERFKRDAPSGVMLESKDIVLNGANGIQFFSQDSLIGDTREIWFIKNGFLYEVTTVKELDSWLNEIIQTWHFI